MNDLLIQRMVARIVDLERRLSALERMEHRHTRFGDLVGNHTEFESDGTLRMVGGATVYNDWNRGFAGAKVPAANAPTWSAFLGNLSAYTFAVNDYLEVEPFEFEHGWKEASLLEFHVHWATNGSDGTDRGVKWEIEYTWANTASAAPFSAFITPVVISAETTIPASTTTKSHIYSSVGTLTPSGGKIGAYLVCRVRRITAAGTAPTANPFGLAVGIHRIDDTIGSRTTSAK